MAKLSDVNQNPALDSLESLKRRYQRQNRELAKANANQAQQIQALQTEIANQNAENIRLSSEIIHLQRQLDVRDSRHSLGVSDGTKRLLEGKLSELADLVRGLDDGGNIGGGRRRLSGKRFPTAMKPEPRERPECLLQDIPEHGYTGQIPASPLFSGAKRSENRFDSPSKTYVPLDSAMFDIRPRRRRDSTNVENLIVESRGSASVPKTEEQTSEIAREQPKRKYPEITEPNYGNEDMEDRIVPPRLSDLGDVFSSPIPTIEEVPPAQPEVAKEVKEPEPEPEPAPKRDSRNTSEPVKLDITSASRFVSSNRRSFENVRELANLSTQEPPAPATTESRRVLEPKSSNIAYINNSPVKIPTATDFEYIKKDKLSPKDREPVKKSAKISAKPIIVQGGENTMTPEKNPERNRRTRGVAVNYALPALNKKMRRDSETLVDAVTGIQPKRRSNDDASRDNSAAPTPVATPLEGGQRVFKSNIDELERRTNKMSIHHDAPVEAEPVERALPSKVSERASGSMSERDIRKLMAERASRGRESRLEEARKDIYAFTTIASPDAAEAVRKPTSERHSIGPGPIVGSHQRRTSGGLIGGSIGIGSGVRKDGESRTSTSSTSNLKSASDLLEERRRRRATLGGATGTGSLADGKLRKTVGFVDTATEKDRTSSSRDARRRSMVV
ncbi:hypothetical protein ABW20_dc0101465 [Dactylellina cionopaga]|nr:hypothetical protein ABW20_dc0101465 [Dactylellina cionopaga]